MQCKTIQSRSRKLNWKQSRNGTHSRNKIENIVEVEPTVENKIYNTNKVATTKIPPADSRKMWPETDKDKTRNIIQFTNDTTQ